jgi:hypothetical protein
LSKLARMPRLWVFPYPEPDKRQQANTGQLFHGV